MPGEVLFETAHLQFRLWQDTDLPLAQGLWGDPDVMSLLGGPLAPAAVRERLQQEQANWRTHSVQYWPISLRANGEMAGCAGLSPWGPAPGEYMAGVHLHRSMWGRRLGEEAGEAVLRVAFSQVHAAAVVAGHHPENAASRRLLTALGFTFERLHLWPPTGLLHPFYRLERANARPEWLVARSATAGSSASGGSETGTGGK